MYNPLALMLILKIVQFRNQMFWINFRDHFLSPAFLICQLLWQIDIPRFEANGISVWIQVQCQECFHEHCKIKFDKSYKKLSNKTLIRILITENLKSHIIYINTLILSRALGGITLPSFLLQNFHSGNTFLHVSISFQKHHHQKPICCTTLANTQTHICCALRIVTQWQYPEVNQGMINEIFITSPFMTRIKNEIFPTWMRFVCFHYSLLK